MSQKNAPSVKPISQMLGRGSKQERSIARRGRIAEAAIEVLATHGVAGMTHRLVAQRACVSLAATTYYYNTKFDIFGCRFEI